MSISEIIQKLVEKRGLVIDPVKPEQISWEDLKITGINVRKVITIIEKHIQNNNKIAIYGDYDVDGLCATAILWQTIYANYKNVFPHIPDRRSEGYGLSKAGIDHCLGLGAKLIITVDSGIVAHDQIAYAKSQGLEVIVVDHHEKADKLPPTDGIIHSTATCAAGLAYFLAKELGGTNNLDLATLAVICDLVPLTGVNRSIAKFGLETLNKTIRVGLRTMINDLNLEKITAYSVGFIIGPRLNATGRLTHAMDSLRLLCTNDPIRAAELAKSLNETNLKRQQLTEEMTQHAMAKEVTSSVIAVADKSYDEGVIGLIASKLVEKHYRPAIAISVGDEVCKASARSIAGFDITKNLRKLEKLFTSVGGHTMAAGFSFPTKQLKKVMTALAKIEVPKELLVRKNRFDLELPLEFVSWDLYLGICSLEPFGLGNPMPIFLAKNCEIYDTKIIGKTGKHVKFTVFQNNISFPAVQFNSSFNPPLNLRGGHYDIYYQIDADTYRGPGNLQLIVKSLKSI